MLGTSPFAAAEEESDRRTETRHDFTGGDVLLLSANLRFTLHLRDLSRTGICGLTVAPLETKENILLLFEDWDAIAAKIRWVRGSWIGAAFAEPLTHREMQRLRLRW